MTAADLHFGQQVRYLGQLAEIIDIRYNQHRPRVQLRLLCGGRRRVWAAVGEVERV